MRRPQVSGLFEPSEPLLPWERGVLAVGGIALSTAAIMNVLVERKQEARLCAISGASMLLRAEFQK